MTRPSETIQAGIGSIVGAVLIIAGLFTDTSKITTEAAGAITLLLSWVAFGVTAFVARKQRAGTLTSGAAGEVRRA